jgi:hypothetical protein
MQENKIEYDLVLMSGLPLKRKLDKGKLYLKLEDGIIKYTVLDCSNTEQFGEIKTIDMSSSVAFPKSDDLSEFSQIKEEILKVIEVRLFLKHVVYGEQDKVKEMLKNNVSLVLSSTNFDDCANIHFTQVTALQYAVWALDYNMWTMFEEHIINCLGDAADDIIKKQLKPFTENQEGIDIKKPKENKNSDQDEKTENSNEKSKKNEEIEALIQALTKLIEDYDQLCYDSWYEVGKQQRLLPTHVIKEYIRKDKTLVSISEERFVEKNDFISIERTDFNSWYEGTSNSSGKYFAHTRGGGAVVRSWNPKNWLIKIFKVIADTGVLAKIKITRDMKSILKGDLEAIKLLLERRNAKLVKFIDKYYENEANSVNVEEQARLAVDQITDNKETVCANTEMQTLSIRETDRYQRQNIELGEDNFELSICDGHHLQENSTCNNLYVESSSNITQMIPHFNTINNLKTQCIRYIIQIYELNESYRQMNESVHDFMANLNFQSINQEQPAYIETMIKDINHIQSLAEIQEMLGVLMCQYQECERNNLDLANTLLNMSLEDHCNTSKNIRLNLT